MKSVKSLRLKYGTKGAAIALSPDMIAFSKEAADAVLENKIKTHPVNKRALVYGRNVKHPRYGERFIRVEIEELDIGTYGASSHVRSGVITIPVDEKGVANTDDSIESLIQHELVHMFDPKLVNPSLRESKWGADKYRRRPSVPYPMLPWEQDAEMAAISLDKIKHILESKGGDWDSVFEEISSINPEDSYELSWFDNPKAWRKYLNTLYKTAMEMKAVKSLRFIYGKKSSNQSISDVILDLVNQWKKAGYSPARINDGFCHRFASSVIGRVPGSKLRSSDDHWWIEYQGRNYDAEHPYGVDIHSQLNFFSRNPSSSVEVEKLEPFQAEGKNPVDVARDMCYSDYWMYHASYLANVLESHGCTDQGILNLLRDWCLAKNRSVRKTEYRKLQKVVEDIANGKPSLSWKIPCQCWNSKCKIHEGSNHCSNMNARRYHDTMATRKEDEECWYCDDCANYWNSVASSEGNPAVFSPLA